jgi:hypothetical protein
MVPAILFFTFMSNETMDVKLIQDNKKKELERKLMINNNTANIGEVLKEEG